jgi:cephalosporin hydroxylase
MHRLFGREPRPRTEPPEASTNDVVNSFHRLYYDSHVWESTRWLGIQVLKCPMDLWIYQEVLHELRPDVIVETGTFNGGSALFLASVCDLLGRGRVISIDIETRPGLPAHPRITYLEGRSSLEPSLVADLRSHIGGEETVMAILDSDHSKPHVLGELHTYAQLVTSGQYLIVEDSNVNGHPVVPEFGPGPMEALDEFLAEGAGFSIDQERERLYMTFNPRGYLRKA